MIMGMDAPKDGVWVDLGCGTVGLRGRKERGRVWHR